MPSKKFGKTTYNLFEKEAIYNEFGFEHWAGT